MKTSLEIRYVLESKVLQDATVKLCSSFFLVIISMQVLFVLRFYHPDKTDKINPLIHDSGSKMAVKMSTLVKKLMYVLNCFELPLAIFTLFGSVVNKCCGSCIQSIRFWI